VKVFGAIVKIIVVVVVVVGVGVTTEQSFIARVILTALAALILVLAMEAWTAAEMVEAAAAEAVIRHHAQHCTQSS
jgi:hypothetical protein